MLVSARYVRLSARHYSIRYNRGCKVKLSCLIEEMDSAQFFTLLPVIIRGIVRNHNDFALAVTLQDFLHQCNSVFAGQININQDGIVLTGVKLFQGFVVVTCCVNMDFVTVFVEQLSHSLNKVRVIVYNKY